MMSFRPFEALILIMIMANCVALAVFTPFPHQDSNAINAALVGESMLPPDLSMLSVALPHLDVSLSVGMVIALYHFVHFSHFFGILPLNHALAEPLVVNLAQEWNRLEPLSFCCSGLLVEISPFLPNRINASPHQSL